MERFNIGNPENKETEVTREMVLKSLIENPENYSIFSKWKKAKEDRVTKENSSHQNLMIEVEATIILVDAIKTSRTQESVENVLNALYDTATMANGEGEEKLRDHLLGLYDTLLAKYEENYPQE